jgi:iron-sulfur cluster assembly protein
MLLDQTQTEIINLTPSAINAVRELLKDRELNNHALRIFVSGGGCSGLQYGMALESNFREKDFTTEFDDVKVVIDEISIDYLRGATVDYVEDIMGSGFKIDNPNAVAACGCGSSFRTNEDTGSQSRTQGCAGC